jgi:hypothetical protein
MDGTKNIILSKISKTHKDKYHTYVEFRIKKHMKIHWGAIRNVEGERGRGEQARVIRGG